MLRSRDVHAPHRDGDHVGARRLVRRLHDLVGRVFPGADEQPRVELAARDDQLLHVGTADYPITRSPDHPISYPPPTKFTISIWSRSRRSRGAVGVALDDDEVALDGDAAWVDLELGQELRDRHAALEHLRVAVQRDVSPRPGHSRTAPAALPASRRPASCARGVGPTSGAAAHDPLVVVDHPLERVLALPVVLAARPSVARSAASVASRRIASRSEWSSSRMSMATHGSRPNTPIRPPRPRIQRRHVAQVHEVGDRRSRRRRRARAARGPRFRARSASAGSG